MEPNLTVARHAATRDLLGAFALGAVDAEEAASVRAHLATCAECQAEMAELWLAVDSLPGLVEPMEPPPALRDRIAAAIAAEAASPAPVPPAPSATPAPEPVPTIAPAPPVPEPIRKPASFWSRATPWAAAAAILLLLSAGLLVWNLRLREQIGHRSSYGDDRARTHGRGSRGPRRGHLSPAGRPLHSRCTRPPPAGTGSGLRGLVDRRRRSGASRRLRPADGPARRRRRPQPIRDPGHHRRTRSSGH